MGFFKRSASLLALSVLTSIASAQTSVDTSAPKILSDALINDARLRGRADKLPPNLSATEAEVLLQAAVRVDPQNMDAWRLLAEACEANNHDEQAREAYKQLLKLDPKNLVAQVRFLELLADDRPLEQQLKLYLSALEKKTLDQQVRSEVAVRAAQLYLQRGETDNARKMLTKAIELNDVNVRAWQAYCQLEATPGELPSKRLHSLINLLLANPYQPDALLAGARMAASAGVHDAAADWQMAGVEQYRIAGKTIPADIYVDLAVELCIADRRLDAEPLITELLKLDDAPMAAGLLSLAIHSDPDAALVDKLRKRIADAMPKGSAPAEERIAALTDALWAELAYFPELSETVDSRLETLRTLVKPEDKNYLRLFGWRLLRLGKNAEARKVLEPLVETDPIARLGVSRAAVAMGDTTAAGNQLVELWRERPQGLTALLTAREARKQGVKLPESSLANSVRTELTRYSKTMLFAHRQPRELVLITPSLTRRSFKTGEPIVVNLKVANSSDHALSVGPGGAVSTSLSADATIRVVAAQNFMGYAVENAPRTYRLEAGETLTIPLRIDQGALRQWLDSNPTLLTPVSVSVTFNPLRTADSTVPGLGGQTVFAADVDRVGFNFGSTEQVNKIATELDTYESPMRLLVTALLQATAPTLPDKNPESSSASTKPAIGPADLKSKLNQLVIEQYKNGTPVMQAWLVRNAPADNTDDIKAALETQLSNADPVVRMMVYGHLAATQGKTDKDATIKRLSELADKDQDPIAQSWARCMVDELTLPAATQPATNP